jgi:hypothetical protein
MGPLCLAATRPERRHRGASQRRAIAVTSAPRNLPEECTVPDARAFSEFVQFVVLRAPGSALAGVARRRSFVAKMTALAAGDNPPFRVDCWRLNPATTRPLSRD